jgi:multidrug resistance efflux pump
MLFSLRNNGSQENGKAMSKELQASKVGWKKLRRVVFTTMLLGGIGAAVTYVLSGDSLLLSADGIVTRQRVAVAAPWQDARVRDVYVRPGDKVEAGQKIATVESATMLRSLAELAAEKARISSRVAQLDARRGVVTTLMPLAEQSVIQTEGFLNALHKAGTNGLTVSKNLQERRHLSLKAEQGSLGVEVEANKKALDQVSAAYNDLQTAYNDGVLYAPVSGYIGANVAMVGEVLSGGKDWIANIYTGPSFVLAYIPESYLFDVEQGQKVAVKARGQTVAGYIEKVLPVTEALPPEFQLPNKTRGRGQLVHVALSDANAFAIDQKSQVTSCYFQNCRTGLSEAVRASLPGMKKFANTIGDMGKSLTAALWAYGPAGPASAKTASSDTVVPARDEQ